MQAIATSRTQPTLLAGGLAAMATIVVAAGLIVATNAAMMPTWASGPAVAPNSPATQPTAQPPTVPSPRTNGQLAPLAAGDPYVYSNVAERAVKSVVSITTRIGRPASAHPSQGPWWRRFEYRQIPRGARRGAGSGVIVRKDGVVLTNNHVIKGAGTIKVQLADNRTFDAEVIGSDPQTDIAVLKLKGTVGKLHVLPLADSDKVRLGEIVLAIGNSFGRLHHTVTMGIVSAKGRGNVGIVDYEDFIQTDAAINPGNSGGALVNMRGQLIGINTAIASRSGGSQGVGFTIPANMARDVMQSILSNGSVDRGWLGVVIQDMTDPMVKAFATGGRRGVLIGDVKAGSPAHRGGIKRGDVVLRVDGKKTDRSTRLRNIVGLRGAGRTVALDLVRRGKPITVKVKLGSAPGQKRVVRRKTRSHVGNARLGLGLSELDRDLARRLGVSGQVREGAIISEVQPGSIAQSAGLRVGDVVIAINRKPVPTAKQAAARIDAARADLLLTVRRGDHTRFVMLRIR